MSSAPTAVPSTLNCTPATATLSDALALSVTNPLTVPAGGLVNVTVGGVGSPCITAVACPDGGPTFPAPSCAVTL